jgi:hypothetical protein
MSGHARLGPSDKTWPYCPGSPRVNADYEDIAGAAAIDGTGSHILLEECLKHGVRAEAYDGQIVGANHPDNPMGWLVSPDRVERVQEGLDYVSRRYAELSKRYPAPTYTIEMTAESHSDPGARVGRDDWWGTVDITIAVMNPFGSKVYLEVIDYKDGRMYVDVKGNTQLLIIQPKTNPSVRYDELTGLTMKHYIETLTAAAAATDDPNAPLVPGDHCTWCSHGRAKNCTAKSEKSLERIGPMTNDVR